MRRALLVRAACTGEAADGKFLIYASAVTPDAQQRSRELRVERVIEKPVRRSTLIDAVQELQTAF